MARCSAGGKTALGVALGAGLSLLAVPPVVAQSGAAGIDQTALEIACGPHAVYTPPVTTLQIAGAPGNTHQELFGLDDAVLVTGGARRGLEPGQEFYIRRSIVRRGEQAGHGPIGIHTAGWLRIVEVGQDSAVGRIVYACHGVLRGDFLEPFSLPVVPETRELTGEADYDAAGEVLFGPEGRTVAGTRTLVVVSRGSDHGIVPGQRFTIFRRSGPDRPVAVIGEGTALAVRPETSTIRLDRLRDIVYAGDRVAVHR